MHSMDAKPPYVQFEVRPVEDREASEANGHWIGKDVVFAIITPAGSKDRIEKVADQWLKDLDVQCRQDRFPRPWLEDYKKMYEAYKAGQEFQPDGYPIKNWPVASPAQVQLLLSINVLTVEQLAEANEETISRLGIGGRDLALRAKTFLEVSKNDGKTAKEVSNLKQENTTLKSQVEELMERLKKAESTINTLQKNLSVEA